MKPINRRPFTRSHKLLVSFSALLLTLLATPTRADDASPADKPADNSAQNTRDRDRDSTTPLQQGNSAADIDVTRRIRKAVIADKSLSVNAHNIKIITLNGKVTLRGPVESAEEKKTIHDLACKETDSSSVDDQVDIRTSKSDR